MIKFTTNAAQNILYKLTTKSQISNVLPEAG